MTTILSLTNNGKIANKDSNFKEHRVEEQQSEHYGNWPNDAGVSSTAWVSVHS
jgi:hypothetical protein